MKNITESNSIYDHLDEMNTLELLNGINTEDKKVAIIAIQKLEKKVFALTIIIAITITLIGKEFADKIMESFSSFEKITEKVESAIPNSNETKEGETREVSMNYDFSSFWFS